MSLTHAFWRYLTIWNCREHFINNFFKACTLKVFEGIWNCREKNENIVSSLNVFSRYIHKTNNLSYNIWTHSNKGLGHKFLNLITALPGIVLFWHIYNVFKAYILVVPATIWNCREKIKTIWNDLELQKKMKTLRVQYDTFWLAATFWKQWNLKMHSDAFWDLCSTTFRVFDSATHPFHFYWKFERFIFLIFFKWSVGPGLLGL